MARVDGVVSRRAVSVKCPGCGATTRGENNPDRPFCSRACRLIDLGVWLDERYRIPGPAMPIEGPEEGRGEAPLR